MPLPILRAALAEQWKVGMTASRALRVEATGLCLFCGPPPYRPVSVSADRNIVKLKQIKVNWSGLKKMGPPVKTEPVSVKDCESSVKDLPLPVKTVKDDIVLKQS